MSILGFIFMGLMFYGLWKVVSAAVNRDAAVEGVEPKEIWSRKLRSSAIGNEPGSQKLASRELAASEYEKRPGAPRFYPAGLKKVALASPLLFVPLILTIIFARDPIALTIMGLATLVILGIGIGFFQREERRRYNVIHDAEEELLINTSDDGLRIPDDWVRKYL